LLPVRARPPTNGGRSLGFLGSADGVVGVQESSAAEIEIAPEISASFFNYFVERRRIYTSAYNEAVCKFIGSGMAPRASNSRLTRRALWSK